MGNKIYVEINRGNQPIWLSPTVGGGVIKIKQNISITIGKKVTGESEAVTENGPGELSTVILRDFNLVVSESDFRNAEYNPPDEHWNPVWKDGKDLAFTYGDGEPFADGTDQYQFEWYNFYTLITPRQEKKAELPVEVYDISGVEVGYQGTCMVRFALPAYISSLEPDISKKPDIVKTDAENNIYTISQGSLLTVKWTGAADYTDGVVLRKNGIMVGGSYKINGSFLHGEVVGDVAYELTVTNNYEFSHIRTLIVQKTGWHKIGGEKGIFQEDVYACLNYNPRIFRDGDNYYAYWHPTLYKKGTDGEWRAAARNELYKDYDYSCFASYLSGGTLYVAGNIKGSGYYSFCGYELSAQTWKNIDGCVNLPKYSETVPMCCGFAVSLSEAYFYCRSGERLYMNRYESGLGWGGGQFFFDVPAGMKLIDGTMGFYINQFYVAMLCQEKNGGGDKWNNYIYLYDCIEESQKYIMKKQVASANSTVTLLETSNYLCLVTENELIKYAEKTVDNNFFPPVNADCRAWLGCDGERIFGIFPDKNFWQYQD